MSNCGRASISNTLMRSTCTTMPCGPHGADRALFYIYRGNVARPELTGGERMQPTPALLSSHGSTIAFPASLIAPSLIRLE
jgi:hypothetical protein